MNTATSEERSVEFKEEDISKDDGLGGAISAALGPLGSRATPARTAQRLGRKVARLTANVARRKDLA